jgi:outer membrane protein
MNKSLILLFAFAVTTTLTYGQTSAGNMMVGGGISFSSSSREGGSANDASSFTFSPDFGYFISDNFAIGASVSLGSSRQGTGVAKTTSNSFGIGPFARYYLFTSNEQFGFFGQARLDFQTGRTDPAFGEISKRQEISFALQPGAAYFLNDHWAIELYIAGFSLSSEDPNTEDDNDKINQVNFSLSSFDPTLGFRYHF